jgi:hypothetical protein
LDGIFYHFHKISNISPKHTQSFISHKDDVHSSWEKIEEMISFCVLIWLKVTDKIQIEFSCTSYGVLGIPMWLRQVEENLPVFWHEDGREDGVEEKALLCMRSHAPAARQKLS